MTIYDEDYVYIAAPFFKPHELKFVQDIESYLSGENFAFYSPRQDGVLMDMTDEERQTKKREIFVLNTGYIRRAMCVVAVIDDRDVGTIWEMGFAHALNVPVISISNQDYGLNVMLAESVQAHVRNLDDMTRAVRDPHFTGEIVRNVY